MVAHFSRKWISYLINGIWTPEYASGRKEKWILILHLSINSRWLKSFHGKNKIAKSYKKNLKTKCIKSINSETSLLKAMEIQKL